MDSPWTLRGLGFVGKSALLAERQLREERSRNDRLETGIRKRQDVRKRGTVKLSNLGLNILRLLVLLIVLGISIYIFMIRDQAAKFAAYGYPGIFLISILANGTILLPAPGIVPRLRHGRSLQPVFCGLTAGAARLAVNSPAPTWAGFMDSLAERRGLCGGGEQDGAIGKNRDQEDAGIAIGREFCCLVADHENIDAYAEHRSATPAGAGYSVPDWKA